MTAAYMAMIEQAKKERNAVIMAHYYQPQEIQAIADFVGDSLQLAIQAHQTQADVIVSCGVQFMAESAKILNPQKTVLLPVPDAGCPMADMVTANQLRVLKQAHPEALVVCYVNSSAAVKAESYICCTSANAVKVVSSLPADREIIFVPDKNLASYVEKVTGRSLIKVNGYCPIHDQVQIENLVEQKRLHPQALVVVHPECPPQVTNMADAVLSTGGMLQYIKQSSAREFVIGTEVGFLYSLQQQCPDKALYTERPDFLCADMKKTDLRSVATALTEMKQQVEVPEEIRCRAFDALQRMIQV